jgi:hypothetical protein
MSPLQHVCSSTSASIGTNASASSSAVLVLAQVLVLVLVPALVLILLLVLVLRFIVLFAAARPPRNLVTCCRSQDRATNDRPRVRRASEEISIWRIDILMMFNHVAALQLCLRMLMCIPMPQPPPARLPDAGTRGGK